MALLSQWDPDQDKIMLLEVRNLTKVYDTGFIKVNALKGINFKVEEGELTAIMGPSGSGKTTLMDILGCLSRPTQGLYLFKGKEVNRLSEEKLAEIRNSHLGFVFQSFNLLPQETILANTELPLIYKGVHYSKRREKAVNMLSSLGLKNKINNFPNQLSGGEQQRVAIARALINDPYLILADEPTGNLDRKTGENILKIFIELNQKGKTIIIITHDSFVASYCSRIIRLEDGKIVKDELL